MCFKCNEYESQIASACPMEDNYKVCSLWCPFSYIYSEWNSVEKHTLHITVFYEVAFVIRICRSLMQRFALTVGNFSNGEWYVFFTHLCNNCPLYNAQDRKKVHNKFIKKMNFKANFGYKNCYLLYSTSRRRGVWEININ